MHSRQAQTRSSSPTRSSTRILRSSLSRPTGPAAIAQRLQRQMGNRGTQHLLQAMMSPGVQRQQMEEEEQLQGKFALAQRQPLEAEESPEDEELQMKANPATLQRQEVEEEEPLQGQFTSGVSAQLQGDGAAPGNGAGLPDSLRAGLETLSGVDLSGVRVHRNSAKPAQLNALAYTQGQDIHVGPGQEKHLPHEGWHAVQQIQGRVQPTMQAKGVSINDDAGLEREADVMGGRASASQLKIRQHEKIPNASATSLKIPSNPVQRRMIATGDAAGFATLANSIIAVQHEISISSGGEVRIRNTDVQGPPTPEAQELINIIRTVIGDSNTTTIEFIHGTTTSRASDRRVVVGSYPQGKIDLDDVSAFGSQEQLGLEQGITSGSALVHEIYEQYRKQVHGEGLSVAHAAGITAEERAAGATRGRETIRQINATTTEITIPYTHPDGRVVEVIFDLVGNNVTNVRRRERP